MTTDTKRIQKQFEDWCIATKRGFRDKNGFWMLGDNDQLSMFAAYAQGQRDLIEAMGEPVAYQVISRHGMDNRLYAAQDAPKGFSGFLEIERQVGNTVRALHFVPEVGE